MEKLKELKQHCIEKQQNPYLRAINHFGHKHQISQAIQELSELTVELSRALVGRTDPVGIIGELADVENMLIQMKLIFDPVHKVPEVMNEKMDRLMKRIDSKNEPEKCLKNCEKCENNKCVGD